ncbi:TPA: nucleotidyltransferase domain-containing protein [Candidatus Micrarchaeota archaeon]|nr:nucleotidyltransferase domain-containing protein [Candidatus Micrarchaeota archaeon]
MVSLDNSKLILETFLKEPTKSQYIRQIANNCKLSYERVQHYLKELEKIKVLNSKTKGKIKEYTLNRKHELAVKIFTILEMEKKQKFYSKNPQFQSWLVNLVSDITKNFDKHSADIRFILLFGSTARDDSKVSSDVDILIVARNIDQNLKAVINQLKTKLETLSGKVFSFHLVDYKEFVAKWNKEPIYATIWLDHVVLSGEENFWKEVLELGEPI